MTGTGNDQSWCLEITGNFEGCWNQVGATKLWNKEVQTVNKVVQTVHKNILTVNKEVQTKKKNVSCWMYK